METKVRTYTVQVAGDALAGSVVTTKPVWARRIHATPHGVMMGLDRTLMLTRRDDEVLIGTRDKHGTFDHIVTLAERGFKPAGSIRYHREDDCSISFAIENEAYELKLSSLKLKNGRLTGSVELKPVDAPHFYGEFDLRLVGWSPKEKYIRWRCH